ncbi:MAG: hypothetical protein ACLQDL_04635, partial [Spirochaetia bacterium]
MLTNKTLVAAIVLLPLLSGATVWSAALPSEDAVGVSFFVEPLLQKGFGGTSYDLSFFDPTSGSTGLSRLEFPQLSLEAGGLLGITINRGAQREWLLEVGITHSTFPMSGTMNDYDWTQYPGIPKIPFSYTYSDDSTVSWHASFEAAWTFATVGAMSFALYGTYRYQSMSHVEDSATGWQYVYDTTTGEYALVPVMITTPDVLEYTLTSDSFGLGFLVDLEAFSGFHVELRACYTPVYVSDSDDHKLRTKLSTASGWGNGLYADLKAVYDLPKIGGNITPYIALDGEIIYYVVDTTQTQYWYGNADAGNGAPQGTLITGVGHVITSDQFQLGLRIG